MDRSARSAADLRRLWVVSLVSAWLTGACGDPRETSVLVTVRNGPGAPSPDELRVSIYDDGGLLFHDEGFSLPAPTQRIYPILGTIVAYPGLTDGIIRLGLRGHAAGVAVSHGSGQVASAPGRQVAVTIELLPGRFVDGDGDGVPDPIDNCPGAHNPDQVGCPDRRDAPADGDAGTGQDAPTFDTPPGPLGAPCRGPGDCVSGQCVDGVCCATARCALCQSCAGGDPGTCTHLPASAEDNVPAGACANEFACDGQGSCARKNGSTCVAPGDCLSKQCVDRICCGIACTGLCLSCAPLGECAPVADRDDPDTCTGTSTCDSGGTCRAKNGQVCKTAADCASGFCVDRRCCATACDGPCEQCGASGTCVPVAAGTDPDDDCGTFNCSGEARCAAACGPVCDQACKTSAHCAQGTCVRDLSLTSPCRTNCECIRNICLLGLCD